MGCIDKSNSLYYNLSKLTGDEDKAKDMYARIMNPSFLKDYKIKTGKDGVPDFHDVYRKAKLGKMVDEAKYLDILNRELGSKTLANTQENLGMLSEEVTAYNNGNSTRNYVAVIEKNGTSITSKVVRKNYKTDLLSKKIKTNTDLNNFLKGKLAEIGVGVGELTELERRRGIAGITEFDRAKDATEGIMELIRISNDEKGAQALPEEFAHFALEAIGEGNNLINRLYNTIDENIAEAVLGSQYDEYYEAYEGDIDKLRKEAAGKMLAEYLKAEYSGANISLVERVFESIKDKFSNLNTYDFQKALIDLDATLTKVAKEIMRNDLLKKTGISNITQSQGQLYNLARHLNPDEFDEQFGDIGNIEDQINGAQNNDFIDTSSAVNVELDVDDLGDALADAEELASFNQSQGFETPDSSDDSMPSQDEFENVEQFTQEDFNDFEQFEGIDFEELESRSKASSNNRIKIDEIRKEFEKDCEELKSELEADGEVEKIKKVFLNIESSLYKLRILNKQRGLKEEHGFGIDKLYMHKNMLGNLLNFVYNSLEVLYNDWVYYDQTKPSDVNGKCNQLLIFNNTIKALEYVLNTTDLQSIMDVATMEFDNGSDKKISDIMHKYIEKLSYNIQIAKQFTQDQELVLAKKFLSEKFGDTFEIPMTLSDSKTLSIDSELSNGTQEDVSTLTRLFSSLANSPSMILKMVDQIVKRSNDNRRNKVFEERRKIIALGKKYVQESGSDDFTWFYETDSEGNRTGYYLSPINYGEYDKYYKEIVLDKKNEWLLEDGSINKELFKILMQEFEEVAKEHNDFKNPAWERLTQAQRDFAIEYQKTKESLDDKMFYTIENDIDEEGYFDFDINDLFSRDFKKEKEAFKKRKRSLKTVKIEKSLINKMKSSKTFGEAVKQLGREFKEQFMKTSSETELSDNNTSYLTDFDGKRVYDVPRLFTTKREGESEDNMSMDPISTLVAYADAAENRYEKLHITGMIDVITDIVNKRKLKESPTIFKKLRTNFGDFKLPITTNGEQSNIAKMLQDYKESQIYGMWNADLGNFGDTNISKDKVINAALSQTALTGMALNVLGGISNVDTGRAMMRIESIAGEFFNMKDVAKADIEYAKNIGAVIADAGELIKSTKLGVFIEQFNVLQEYETEVLHTEFDANRFARCCSEQGLFILNNIGEHYLQTRTALAIAMATKLKDKDGKEITLWEAMELVDIDPKHPEYGKKIALKEGVTKADGTEIGDLQDYFNKFTHRAQALNQRMHGIYNYEDRCAAQRYAVGRLFYQFRKYIPVSIQRRFGEAQYNFDLDTPTEGYYRTFGKMLLKIYKEAKAQRCSIFSTGVWKKMNKWEKANCVRSIVEMSQTLLIYGAVQILEMSMGDQPKQSPWALKMLDYRYRRLYSELAAFTPSLGMINEGLKIIDSPFAACRIMDKNIELLEIMNPFNWAEDAVIKQGKYAGHTKGAKAVLQCLPVYSSIINLIDPYEATKFYKR